MVCSYFFVCVIFLLCNNHSDPSNDGLVLAVLDVSKRELFMDIDDKPLVRDLCMPGADTLASRIKECLSDRNTSSGVSISSTQVRNKPVYTASVQQKLKTRAAHDIMTKHIRSVAALAVAHHQKLLERRKLVVEMANRMSHSVKKNNNGFNAQLNRSASFGTADMELSEDDDEEDSASQKDRLTNGHARTFSAASVSSGTGTGTSNGNGVLSAMSSPLPVTTVTTANPPTAAASMAAAFGKVLRPSGLDNSSTDRTKADLANVANVANAGANRARSILLPAVNALSQIPAPSSKLVYMSKQPLEGNNTEEFLNRFIQTQVRHVVHTFVHSPLTYC